MKVNRPTSIKDSKGSLIQKVAYKSARGKIILVLGFSLQVSTNTYQVLFRDITVENSDIFSIDVNDFFKHTKTKAGVPARRFSVLTSKDLK